MATGYKGSNGAITTDSNGFAFVKTFRLTIRSGDVYGNYCADLGGWYQKAGSWGEDTKYLTSGSYYSQGSVSGGEIVDVGSAIGSVSPVTLTTLATSVSGFGSISPSSGVYETGSVVTVTAQPGSGHVCTFLTGKAISEYKTGSVSVDAVMSGDTTTINAEFTKYYTVKFYQNKTSSDSTNKSQSPILYGGTYNLKTLNELAWTRPGYRFLGWNTERDGTGTSYTDGQAISNLTSSAGGTVNLFAQWAQYTITYAANGGDTTPSAQTSYGNVTLASAITRAGYKFGGWKIGSTTYAAGATYNLTSDATATAQWSAYTVSYNAHGGSACESGSGTVTLPTTTRTGYTFNGWYTKASGGTKVGNAGASYSPTATITLHAQWTVNQYTATFNANGGTGGTTKTQDYGTSLTAPTVTRTEAAFTGWSPSVPSTMPAENKTYTAQWTVNQYTATFNANGGTGGTTKTQDYGTALTAPTVTRTGYTFARWSPPVPTTMPDADKTYVAQWTPNTYTVTLDAQGGALPNGFPSSFQVTYGEKYGADFDGKKLPAATKAGYSFSGWFTVAGDSGGTWVKRDAVVAIANDHTLYARWMPKSIYIDFVLYEGATREPLTTYYGTAAEVTAPTRQGYVFNGWKIERYYNKDEDAVWGKTNNPSTPITGSTLVVGDDPSDSVWVKNLHKASDARVTMRATWEHVMYTITAKNASTRWSVEISGDDGKDLPVELGSKPPASTEALEAVFTAYGGYSYVVKLKFDEASVAKNTFFVPTTYGGHGLSRGEDEDGKAVFTGSYTFPSSGAASQEWNAVSNTLTVNFSSPVDIEGNIPSPTMQFAGSTGTDVLVTAVENTDKLKFSYWSYDGVTPISENREIVVPMSGGDATITAVYGRRTLEVSAEVEATAASAVSGLSAYVTANEISEDHITNIGYGLPATWKFAGTIPDGYEFNGWYQVVDTEPGDHGPAGRTRLSENTVFTIPKVYGPLKLQARLRARITFHVEVFGEGVSGRIGVNAKSHAELAFSEYFQLGRTINLAAVPGNGDSYFNGWFEGGVSHSDTDSTRISGKTERMVYSVSKATDIVAYFTATAEVFFVALYQRDAATRSYNIPTPFGTLALETEEGAVDALSDYEEYKDKSGYRPPLSARGVYYQVTGIRRVDASLTQTETQTAGVKRVLRGIPDDRYRPGSGGADIRDPMEVANGMPFSAVIDADCSFIVDFGDTSHRNLEAKVVTGDAGGVARVQNAESVVETGDNYEIGRYEINSKAVAVAIPKNGYKFVGWYANAAGDGDPLSSAVRYEFDMPAQGQGDPDDYAVYAKFARGSFALYEWEGSSANKVLTWKSKVYELSKPTNLTSVRVDTQHYPVFRFKYESFSAPNAQAPSTGVVDFAVDEKDRRLQSQDMRRLPYVTPEGRHIRPERYFQVEVQNDAEVDAIIIGTSGEGLAT